MIDSGLVGSGRGAARAEDAQGTPTPSQTSPRILVYEEKKTSRQPERAVRASSYLTEMCSDSEVGSYLRLIDIVYHSTLGLRVIKKRRSESNQGGMCATFHPQQSL